MIAFYCYSRCSTCQKAKKLLDEHGVSYEMKDISNHQLTKEDFRQLHKRSGLPLKRLFNTSGQLYRSLNLKDRLDTMTPDEAYELLSQYGMLVKRPLLITDQHVLFGFNEEEYKKVIQNV